MDKSVQTEVVETDEPRNEEPAVDRLTQRVKDILKNTFVEIEPGESIIDAVARQYVDVKWKKDVLEKKVTELTRDLKETVELKENVQVECDDMQTHIDSLLLEIQDLKLNLPSIPEASEERVASLESETESLHEEVKRLQAENAALKKENAKLGGNGLSEARLENLTYVGNASRSRKPTRLEDIPEDIEETDSGIENLNRKLHVTLNENDELRKKIDVLESTEKDTQEQLRVSLEKCKGFDQNIEFIAELKLNLENAMRELKTSTSNTKQLESTLELLRDTKDEIQKENEELSQRNEKLEAEISRWREINLEQENNNVLEELQEQLNRITRERDDLDYDILNMRKELDESLNQIDFKDSQITRLNQENESLAKEKDSLLEQLTAVQDESNDKIDLVNTEKSLLEQEQTELKEAVAASEKELNEVKDQLRETEERYAKLENELLSLSEKAEKLQSENENLLMDENRSLRSQYETLEQQVEQFKLEIASLQAEKNELLTRVQENVCDNEKQHIKALLEETTREKDALKSSNNKLMEEVIESQKKLQMTIDSNKESIDMAKQTIESLSHLIMEKDEEINALKVTLESAKNNTELSENFATIKKERDELVNIVTIKHNESLQYHGEIQRLTHLLNEQTSQLQKIIAEKDADLAQLAEKDAELLWTKNELQVLQQRLRNVEESNANETCGIVEHSTQAAEIALLNGKCDALEAALIQEQSNNRMLHHQFNESQAKEANNAKELDRLRTHLVEIESSYTEEALMAEEARKEVEAKLQQLEEKMQNNSTAYTSDRIRANQQVETLQQQMALIVRQRDDIQNKLSIAENKILSQTASLTNLQIVLEQFQQGSYRILIILMSKAQKHTEKLFLQKT